MTSRGTPARDLIDRSIWNFRDFFLRRNDGALYRQLQNKIKQLRKFFLNHVK